jgi:hypothetical protein
LKSGYIRSISVLIPAASRCACHVDKENKWWLVLRPRHFPARIQEQLVHVSEHMTLTTAAKRLIVVGLISLHPNRA